MKVRYRSTDMGRASVTTSHFGSTRPGNLRGEHHHIVILGSKCGTFSQSEKRKSLGRKDVAYTFPQLRLYASPDGNNLNTGAFFLFLLDGGRYLNLSCKVLGVVER